MTLTFTVNELERRPGGRVISEIVFVGRQLSQTERRSLLLKVKAKIKCNGCYVWNEEWNDWTMRLCANVDRINAVLGVMIGFMN